MKISKSIILVVLWLVVLSSCAKHNHATTPTGGPKGEIWQKQVMYNEVIYYYFDTGYSEPLPEGYELVGSVESVDNRNVPCENFKAVKLIVGQEIYACEDEETLFVKFTNGYAKFEPSEETSEYWESIVAERDNIEQK